MKITFSYRYCRLLLLPKIMLTTIHYSHAFNESEFTQKLSQAIFFLGFDAPLPPLLLPKKLFPVFPIVTLRFYAQGVATIQFFLDLLLPMSQWRYFIACRQLLSLFLRAHVSVSLFAWRSVTFCTVPHPPF